MMLSSGIARPSRRDPRTRGAIARRASLLVLLAAAPLATACDDPTRTSHPAESPRFSYTNYASSLTASFRVATVGPAAGQAVTFDGTASAGPQTITSFEWTWGDGTPGATRATQLGQVHTFAAPGTYLVTLKITDATGATASQTQSVTIASAGRGTGFVMNVSNPVQGQYVRFSALGSNLTAPGVKLLWNIQSGYRLDTGVTTGLVALRGSTFKVRLVVQHPGAPAQLFDSTFTVQAGPDIPYDMALWLRADKDVALNASSNVVQWKDQSGNDAHAGTSGAAGTAPQTVAACLGGRPCVRFGGAHLTIPWAPGLGSASQTYFVVTQPGTNYAPGAHGAPLLSRCKTGTCARWQGYALYDEGHADGSRWQALWADATRDTMVDLSVGGSATLAPTLVDATVAGSNTSLNINGELASRTAGVGFVPSVASPVLVGGGGSPTNWYTGDIAEILIYPRALTSGEIAAVQAYLMGKYKINRAPSVDFAVPTSVYVMDDVHFDAIASDPDGDPVHVSWDFGDNLYADDTMTVTHTYWAAGDYTVTATVVDSRGALKTTSHVVRVLDKP